MATNPWDAEGYFSVTAASFRDGMLQLTFANGSAVEVSPEKVLPKSAEEVRWSDMRINEFGWLVIPTLRGEVELAGDVVRINTDDAYYAHLKKIGAAERL